MASLLRSTLFTILVVAVSSCGSSDESKPQAVEQNVDSDYKVGNYAPMTDVQKQRALAAINTYLNFSRVADAVGKNHRGIVANIDLITLLTDCNIDVREQKVQQPGADPLGYTRVTGAACPVKFAMETTVDGALRSDWAQFEAFGNSAFKKVTKLSARQTLERSGTENYIQKSEGTFTIPDEGEVRFLRNFRSFQNGLDGDEKIVLHFKDFTLEFYLFSRRESNVDNDPSHMGVFQNGKITKLTGVDFDLFSSASQLTMGMANGHIK